MVNHKARDSVKSSYPRRHYNSQKKTKKQFETKEDAEEYIKTQPRLFDYRIVTWKEPETDSEWLEFNDAWDAIGGDWQG